MGASAGGTEVILNILSQLRDRYTTNINRSTYAFRLSQLGYAKRLNDHSLMNVHEAVDGERLLRGHALIAPGNKHMEIEKKRSELYVKLNSKEAVNHNRPSVDVLFKSAVKFGGKNKMAIILSGMGTDGSEGMLELRKSGTTTIAQDIEIMHCLRNAKRSIKNRCCRILFANK